MDFVVAANSGTHVYRAAGLEKPALLRSLPPAQAGNPHCLAANAESGYVAVLLQSGAVGVWDTAAQQFAATGGAGGSPACEVPPQSGPITRCYFSPRGSFLVTWEPLGTIHRIEQRPASGGGGGGASSSGAGGGEQGGPKAITRAENLSIWALTRRPPGPADFDAEVEKDGKQRLGVNVDHLDGRSGLLIRRIDPGLIDSHNREARAGDTSRLILPGDRITAVNDEEMSAGAHAMAAEIQRAQRLRLRLRRGPGWALSWAAARFFAPQFSPLRWPPVTWSTDEQHAFRAVSNEIQVLDGRTLQQLRRLHVDNISQMAVSPGGLTNQSAVALAAFCPAGTSAAPAMVRVYTDFGKGAKPALTKSFFSDALWVTMRWDPCVGTDLLVLVHSSELTEADVEGRTLHGQGGNGLYLLRAEEATEPIASLSGSQDGVILDVQWCPVDRTDTRSLVMLQGPQPALVSVFSYLRGGPASAPRRIDLGRFGVRNCLRWDPHGRSFVLRVQSLRGAGISSEADSIDLFDASLEGNIARRAGAAVAGRRDREQVIGPSVTAVDFSPDGRVLLAVVEAHFGAELKFLNAGDGAALYRLKFEEIYAALWRPLPPGAAPAPDFPPPPEEMRLGTLAGAAILEVELCDREVVRRRARALQGRLRDIERLKCRGLEALDQQQREKANQEGELRSSLAKLERELELLEQPDALVFEINSAWGSHLLECRVGDSCREVARRFVRDHHMDMPLAQPLAERMEQRLRRSTLNNGPGEAPAPAAPKRHGPKPKVIDLGDKDAVRRRVRALQKKLREIEKLKNCPALIVDQLQKEKLASEAEVRHQCAVLERELDLLERLTQLPKMVFDVETDVGVRYIEFREGDDCLDLAQRFCQDHGLDEELVEPLADHMERRLRDQATVQQQQQQQE